MFCIGYKNIFRKIKKSIDIMGRVWYTIIKGKPLNKIELMEVKKMENLNKARIAYDKKEDQYNLMLSTDGGETWGLSCGSPCQRAEHDKPDDEPMFVHVGLIESMKKAILNGFEIVY